MKPSGCIPAQPYTEILILRSHPFHSTDFTLPKQKARDVLNFYGSSGSGLGAEAVSQAAHDTVDNLYHERPATAENRPEHFSRARASVTPFVQRLNMFPATVSPPMTSYENGILFRFFSPPASVSDPVLKTEFRSVFRVRFFSPPRISAGADLSGNLVCIHYLSASLLQPGGVKHDMCDRLSHINE